MMLSKQKPIPLVGLTGGIGSGKSAVADLFSKRNIPIIDTDQIARWLTQKNGLALSAISHAFGKEMLTEDGILDRQKMRQLVFSDQTARKKLESILHPMIQTAVVYRVQLLSQQASPPPYIIIDIPLLTETGFLKSHLSRILVVLADTETQISRVMDRDHLTRDQVQQILDAQATNIERRNIADDLIENQADITHLETDVEKLDLLYRQLFT